MTVVLLVLDLAWCPVLPAAEAARPRLGHDERRWSTVFPMGMTAAALSVATAVGVPWLSRPGQVLLWAAVVVWLVLAADAVRAARAGGGVG